MFSSLLSQHVQASEVLPGLARRSFLDLSIFFEWKQTATLDEGCSIDALHIHHDILRLFVSVLLEDAFLELHVLLIIRLVGVEVALGVEGQRTLVLAVDALGFLAGEGLCELGEGGLGLEHY